MTGAANTLDLLVHQVNLGRGHVLHLVFHGMDIGLPLQVGYHVHLIGGDNRLPERGAGGAVASLQVQMSGAWWTTHTQYHLPGQSWLALVSS